MTVKLSDRLAAEIEAESRRRKVSKSAIVRERLESRTRAGRGGSRLDAISDLIGSVVDDLPADLSARTEHYLRATAYGQNRSG
jgi:hypothetical protein